MRNDFDPAIDEVLEILNNVTDRLGDDKVTSLLARLEAVILFLAEDVGDFSPAPGFDKTMTGAVAAPITAATGLICDPYQVCARLGATHDDGAMTANFYGGTPDMGKILKEPAHNATLGGEVQAG